MQNTNSIIQKYELGFYSAVFSFLAIVGFAIVQVMQLLAMLSFPGDAILIYSFSLAIAAPYLVAMVSLHHSIEFEKRLWSHIALLFGVMYNVFVTMTYGIQLASVIPQQRAGAEVNGFALTPHSFFWTLDGLGYIFFGISTFVAGFVFGRTGFERFAKLFFILNGAMVPVIGVVYFYPHFSNSLLLIGSPWVITAGGSLLSLALFFRRKKKLAILRVV